MVGTMNSISIAEALKKHHLIMGTEESRAKYHNKAKDTLYNYYPSLDKDVITSQRNLAAAEETLGQRLSPLLRAGAAGWRGPDVRAVPAPQTAPKR